MCESPKLSSPEIVLPRRTGACLGDFESLEFKGTVHPKLAIFPLLSKPFLLVNHSMPIWPSWYRYGCIFHCGADIKKVWNNTNVLVVALAMQEFPNDMRCKW